MFGGAEFLAWMVLALGAAMATGNLAALIRPPADSRDSSARQRAPRARSLVFVVVGTLAAVWAVASLMAR